MTNKQQPLAYIHPEAKLGNGVVVEPFSYIAADVVIGDGTWIGPNVTIMDGARIGKNCRIFPGAVISAIPQDLKSVAKKPRPRSATTTPYANAPQSTVAPPQRAKPLWATTTC